MYSCDRCSFSTSVKWNFKLHLSRKTVCKPTLSNVPQKELYEKYFSTSDRFKCDAPDCNVHLKTVRIKKMHEAKCRHMIVHNARLIAQEYAASAYEQAELADQQEAEKAIVLPTEAVAVTPGITQNAEVINNTTNIDNSVTNNTTINIMPFGVWKDGHMDHIIKDRKFMMQCLQNKGSGLCDLLRMMHFDSAHPEHHNIRKLVKKEPFIEHHDGKRWRTGLPAFVLQKVSDEMERTLMEFLNENLERRINDVILKSFMYDIGTPMEWDLDISDYECPMDKDMRDDRTLFDTKNMMMQLISKCLYEETQAMNHRSRAIT